MTREQQNAALSATAAARRAAAAEARAAGMAEAERAWREADGERRVAAVRPLARDLSRCARLRDSRGTAQILSGVTDWPPLVLVLAECVGGRYGLRGDAGALASFAWSGYDAGVSFVLAGVTDWPAVALELARHADPRRALIVTAPDAAPERQEAGAA